MTTAAVSQADMIVPVILCGGSGSRLWPSSREDNPKQFLSLMNDRSLLQNTVSRALRISGAKAEHLVIVTLTAMKDEIERQVSELYPAATAHVLREPSARNTAAAVAFAAHYIHETFGANALMWVLPSDHHLAKEDVLFHAFGHALSSARDGNLVTFGISPTRPDTGYGYIRLQDGDDNAPVRLVANFEEKPDLEKAKAYLETRRYLWNSGMFLFAVGSVMDHYERHAGHILSAMRKATENSMASPCPDTYGMIESQPFDKAIMEKSDNITVVPCNPGWSDIGSWESLWDIRDKDEHNNAIDGKAAIVNANGCYVQSKDRLVALAGVENLVIVDTQDALLVANKSDSQSLQMLVNALKLSGAKEIMAGMTDNAQPWTMVKNLQEKSYDTRELFLQAGEQKKFTARDSGLCLYTVLEGTADITADGVKTTLNAFESMNVQTSSPYTIQNNGNAPLKIIEVQKAQAEGIFFGARHNNRKFA